MNRRGKGTEAVALEELERRQRTHTETGYGKLPQAEKGPVRDKLGSAVGMSGKTYERAKEIVEAAAAEPEKFGPLVEKMDRTGKVRAERKAGCTRKDPRR